MSSVPQSDSASPPSAPSAPGDGLKGLATDAMSSAKAACPIKEVPSSGSMFNKLSGGAGGALAEQLAELQTWDQPFYSAAAVGAISTVYWMTAGSDGYSLVNLLCYVVMLRLVVVSAGRNAAAATEGPEKLRKLRTALDNGCILVEKWLPIPTPQHVSSFVGGTASLVEDKVNAMCKAVAAASEPTEEGWHMFKVVIAHLAATVIVLKFFSLVTLAYCYAMYTLCWPAFYERYQDKIDDAVAKFKAKAEPHVETAKVKAKELGAKAYDAVGAKLSAFKEKLKVPPKTDDPQANKTE